MSKKVTESDIYQALMSIQHPEFQSHNLVELGMIPAVRVEQDTVYITVALPFLESPIKESLMQLVQKAAAGTSVGMGVEVAAIEMNPKQRATFLALARDMQPISSRRIGKVLAVMSGKGGVGKSTVAGLLASALRRRGFLIGVLDADITGPSIPKMFGAHQAPEVGPEGISPVKSRTGIKLMSINLLLPAEDQPVVWRGPLISRAIEQFWGEIAWGDLDFLIVDLPPGTSDAALTVTQSLPLDGVILVTSPQDLAGMVVRKTSIMVQHLGVPLIGLVENMSHIICPNCGTNISLFGASRAEVTAGMIGTTLIGRIPIDTQLSVLCDKGAIEEYRSVEFEEVVNKVV
jgi:Mrp family chromosome partitioning ATPase